MGLSGVLVVDFAPSHSSSTTIPSACIFLHLLCSPLAQLKLILTIHPSNASDINRIITTPAPGYHPSPSFKSSLRTLLISYPHPNTTTLPSPKSPMTLPTQLSPPPFPSTTHNPHPFSIHLVSVCLISDERQTQYLWLKSLRGRYACGGGLV